MTGVMANGAGIAIGADNETQVTSPALPTTYVGDELSRLLDQRLSICGWNDKSSLYHCAVKSVTILRQNPDAQASAIIISHRNHTDTDRCLEILKNNMPESAQLIFVNNGFQPANWHLTTKYNDLTVQLHSNTGAYLARNIGALFATAPILLFVEDDCVPYRNLISAHVEAHKLFKCISVRGVYEPKTDNPLNALAAHYDLGNKVFPQHVVSEGNASYESEIFYQVGGWDDEIRFGGGGTDLAHRLLKLEPDMRRQMYYPRARIRHDYAVDEEHLFRKRERQEQSFKRLQSKHGEYRMVRWVYRKYLPSVCASRLDDAARIMSGTDQPRSASCASSSTPLTLIVLDLVEGARTETIQVIANLRRPGWEVVVVTNANGMRRNHPVWLQCVQASDNGWEAIATAVKRAGGDILLFVDTATVLTEQAIQAHVTLHQIYDVVAVQGSVTAPETSNHRAHASYPQYEFPIYADFPVNVSYRREALAKAIEIRGLRGIQPGASLALELLAATPDFRKQIFSPQPKMTWRVSSGEERGVEAWPQPEHSRDWHDLMALSQNLFGVGGVVPRHGSARERHGLEAISRFLKEDHFSRAVMRLKEAVGHFPEVVYGHFSLRFWSILDIRIILQDLRCGPPESLDASELFDRYKLKNLPWFTNQRTQYSNGRPLRHHESEAK
jgi:hypothetical protein